MLAVNALAQCCPLRKVISFVAFAFCALLSGAIQIYSAASALAFRDLQSVLEFSAARAPLSDCRGRGLALGLREPARGGARGAAVPLRRRCGDRPCSLRASRTREEPRRRAWLRAPSGAHSCLVSSVQDRWRSCACIARATGLSDESLTSKRWLTKVTSRVIHTFVYAWRQCGRGQLSSARCLGTSG